MTEKEEAIRLANKVLDDPTRDPDSDLSMLARELLCALERLGEYSPLTKQTVFRAIPWPTAEAQARAFRAALPPEPDEP